MIQGTPKFTGLALGEVTINLLGQTIQIKAKSAFVDPNTGTTYGWTESSGALWSQETLEKLKDLARSMEMDIARVHFATDEVVTPKTAVAGDPGGLGEHVGDAPQV